ncbi:MAG: DUF4256 domain-containing protein [Clostridia bacterium]|nr:DUF4256 domain-containing protein [Clostridia bacterium]
MEQTLFNLQSAEDLLQVVKTRFLSHMSRHPSVSWDAVEARLRNNPTKLWSLYRMESTGGEPDVFDYDAKADEFVFFDFSAETPSGRRNLCYDRAALDARKENKPANSALDLAEEMCVSILTEDEYRALQSLGEFDQKTSSWVATPAEIRALGGALFCDRRYNHVFTYHNGAESYYGVRGFRAKLSV